MRYESYVFKKLVFSYQTVSATTKPGSLMLAIDYDASDDAPSDKTSLMSYAQATRSAPWTECSFAARSSDLTKFTRQRYTRDLPISSGDIKTFDVGNLFIATQGMDNTDAIGELYVDYEVEFQTPQVASALPLAVSSSIFSLTEDQAITASTNILWVEGAYNGLALTVTDGDITFPLAGNYLVTYNMVKDASIQILGRLNGQSSNLVPRWQVNATTGGNDSSSRVIKVAAGDVFATYATHISGTQTVDSDFTCLTISRTL